MPTCLQDFRIDLAGSNAGTMYGKGCYLAENCTKADEYARDEPHGYYEGVFALLLCRVCMGKYLYTTERYEEAGRKVQSGEFDSTAEALESFCFRLSKLHAELPVYWQHCHVNPTIDRFEAQYLVRATSRRLLEDLANACHCAGKKVLAARRIEVSNMWNRYVRFKLRLKEELAASGLPAFASAQLLEGKMDRGEILTYTYLKNLYGQGVQTTISVDGPSPRWMFEAPLELGSDGRRSSQFVLLCRVLCGQMHYTEQMTDSNATAQAKQVGKHAVLANPSSKGPREFIVLSEMQVYPEYLVELAPKGSMEP
eukprot:g3313.t1